MKSKKLQSLLGLTFLLGLSGGLTSCGESNSIILRVLNSEDYIYIQDTQDPESLPDMTDQFIEWVTAPGAPYEGKSISVVYDTSDTNETIYSELLTGKSNYDLINVSDYMAQKIISDKLAVPLDFDMIPNYITYGSMEIRNRLGEIEAIQKVKNPDTNIYEDYPVKLEDYCVGYMWGTFGLLYNPRYYASNPNDQEQIAIKAEEMAVDMQSFDALWNPKYKGTISIKNSMRDTYALGIMHCYKDEFQDITDQYNSGEISLATYQERFSEIFNRCDQKAIDDVYDALTSLKQNIFGLEVDSGKQDIVTKKIGTNVAWSGDAVYSMDQAEDPLQVGDNISELYYSVPELGTNLWFDTWIMPNNARSDDQYNLAHLFLDFICDPVNATQNMEYTGYTSFIAGDSGIDLVRDWYDIRTEEVYYGEDYLDIYSVGMSDITLIDYNDMLSTYHDLDRENEPLYAFVPYEDEEGNIVEEPLDKDDLLEESHHEIVYLLSEEGEETEIQKTYGDLTLADIEYEAVDLSYFFLGTNEEYSEEDFIFYTDEYLSFEDNISVGRQFFCQYPDEATINRTAVMRDYGANNKLVMKMWEKFKSDPLPTRSIIIFVVLIAIIVAIAAYFIVAKIIKIRFRKERKQQNKK